MTISCKKLNDNYYINADVQYECYSKIHLLFMFLLLIPVVILLGLVFPYKLKQILDKN